MFPGRIPFDMFTDFEQLGADGTAVSQAALNASSRGLTSGWNITGVDAGVASGGLLTSQAVASDQVKNGQTGGRGLQYSSATSAAGVIEFVPPAPLASVSFGLAYKTIADPGTFAGGPRVIQCYNTGFGPVGHITDQRDGGDNVRELATAGATTRVAVGSSTWYWLTYKYVNGGTCILNVYDVNMNLVGTCSRTDTTVSNVTSIQLGCLTGPSLSVTNYFDNFILDFSATFPVLPQMVGLNNYLGVSVGSGMSTSERIR